MRFYFLHCGLIEPLTAVDPSSQSGPCYLIRTDLDETNQVGL